MISTQTRLPSLNAQWIAPTLLRRRKLIVLVTLAAFIAGLAAVLLLQPQYAITSTLIFKVGREQEPPPVTSKDMFVSGTVRPEDLASKIELLQSQYLMTEVVKTLGEDYFKRRVEPQTFFQHIKAFARGVVQSVLDFTDEFLIFIGYSQRLAPMDRLVDRLLRDLQVDQVKRADVVTITFVSADREAGVRIVNTLIDLFVQRNIDVYRTPNAMQFLDAQTSEFRTKLNALEARRLELLQRNGDSALAEERAAWATQLRELNGQLSTSMAEVSKLQAEIPADKRAVAEMEPRVTATRTQKRSPVADSLETRLAELQARYQQRRTVFLPDSEPMKSLELEIERVKQAIRESDVLITVGENVETNAARTQLERDVVGKSNLLEGERAKSAYLRDAVVNAQTHLLKLAEDGKELREIDREIAATEQSYLSYRKRMQDMRMSEAMDQAKISNVSVLAPPVASIHPVKPRKTLYVLGGLLGGLLGSAGLLLGLELLRPTVHSRQTLAGLLGVPVLGRLPEVQA